jgi:hypothetical protein
MLGGGGYTLLAEQVFKTKAQSIVDSAGLVGSAFDDLIKQFPQLAGIVTQSTTAIADAAKALADATADIQSKINSLKGQGYLNDLTQLLTDKATYLSQGVDPSLVATYVQLQAQSIVDGAQLTGDAFASLNPIFTQLGTTVHQFAGGLDDAAKQIMQSQQTLQQYLDNLLGGTDSTLSPQARLQAAQATYARDLSSYNPADSSSVSAYTQASDNLLAAARDFYASGTGYQSIFASIQTDIANLMAMTATGMIGSGISTSSIPTTTSTGATVPSVSTSPTATSKTLADVVSAISDLSGKVVVLQTKMDTVKTSVDTGNNIAVAAHTEAHSDAQEANDNLAAIKSQASLAFASPRQ